MIYDLDEINIIKDNYIELNITLQDSDSENNYFLKLAVQKSIKSKEFLVYLLNEKILKYNYFNANYDDNLEFVTDDSVDQIFYVLDNRIDNYNSRRNLITGQCLLLKSLEYLNIHNNVTLIFELGGRGAMYDDVCGVIFFTHANEENHKYSPHIHTSYKNEEASYSLINFKKIAGANYPTKIDKIISEKIKSEKKVLQQFWLDTTNGVWPEKYPSFDIDILR